MKAFDAQAANGFVLSQTSHVEQGVYETKYADIQYPQLVPVDNSAHPFAKSVTYFSSDKFGAADWMNGNADDVPLAGTERAKHETEVHTAAIGYSWGWEEINQAMMLGRNLPSEDAMAARRAYEEMVDRVALQGDGSKGFSGGLFNHADVTVTAATTGGWASATAAQILGDVNQALTAVQTGTNNIRMADTLLLPYNRFNTISSMQMSSGSDKTVFEWIKQNNAYTATTGQPLTIRALGGLDTVGTGVSPAGPRMIAYRRSPEVLKLHLPMPLRFLPVYQDGPLRWVVPGVFRMGGLDIRLPKEVIYIDGI